SSHSRPSMARRVGISTTRSARRRNEYALAQATRRRNERFSPLGRAPRSRRIPVVRGVARSTRRVLHEAHGAAMMLASDAARLLESRLRQIDRLPRPKKHWDRDAWLFSLVQTKSNRKMASRTRHLGWCR